MEDYQKRVLIEERELDARIAKLSLFLESPTSLPLSAEDKTDLQSQYRAMMTYSHILGTRIAKFTSGYKVPAKPLLTFGEALVRIKEGARLARLGWNDKDMFVFLVQGSVFTVSRPPLLGIFAEGKVVNYRAHIDIHLPDGNISTWAPSNSDALAEDWYVVC